MSTQFLTINKYFAKRIFVLEDELYRINYFRSLFGDCESLFIACRADVAIKELSVTKYDIVFLDHDLGTDDPLNNGYEVAKILANSDINKDTPTFVHSLNLPASDRMISLSSNFIQVPFNELMEVLKVYNEPTI